MNGSESSCLPGGHPVSYGQSAVYWVAVEIVGAPIAWGVEFSNGLVDHISKGNARHALRVRGG